MQCWFFKVQHPFIVSMVWSHKVGLIILHVDNAKLTCWSCLYNPRLNNKKKSTRIYFEGCQLPLYVVHLHMWGRTLFLSPQVGFERFLKQFCFFILYCYFHREDPSNINKCKAVIFKWRQLNLFHNGLFILSLPTNCSKSALLHFHFQENPPRGVGWK